MTRVKKPTGFLAKKAKVLSVLRGGDATSYLLLLELDG
jgi:hypothetical protein